MISTCTADRPRMLVGPALAALAAVVLAAPRPTMAHPVSQGALEMTVFPDRVAVLATVSQEEVLVASASRGGGRHDHGEYLADHLRIEADGRPLSGRVVGPPGRSRGRPQFRLEYPLAGVAPARLVIRQDVLREIEFAPGTPWEASFVVRIGLDGGPAAEAGLLTCRDSLVFDCRRRNDPGPESRVGVVAFARHGVLHILTGYDHLLFVAALLLAADGLWDLIKVISAFTAAHTLTLAVSALDLVRLPGAIVEPMIAASIVVVALQNVLRPERSQGRARLLVAFGFGLFHGLGFAGGLLESMSGLGGAGALVAIAAFSAGVEAGHQVVVLPAFGGLCLLRRAGGARSDRERRARRYGSAAISVLGVFYLVAALQQWGGPPIR